MTATRLHNDETHRTILAWGRDGIEDNTIEQAWKTASLPFIHGNIALMPDAHLGFGSTVGSVIATKGAIIPATIGVDIGCGMIATRTDLTSQSLPEKMGPIQGVIRDAVPAGLGKDHGAAQTLPDNLTTRILPPMVEFDDSLLARARNQFGTLGSGNHFVEMCLDQEDRVWIVLHSGSRGVGKEIAERHIAEAKGIMEAYFIELPDPDLAYLVQGTSQFASYVSDMLWAQKYAMENRNRMMVAIEMGLRTLLDREIDFTDRVNAHHNYTEQENHGGQNVWVTRKGAIRARVGDRGIIPGSMGTSSFIVKGLGNKDSFTSASHGAGRKMSRGQARRELTEGSLREAMAGKAWNDREAGDLVDEHPDAYKSIEAVMNAQADLVEIEFTLNQVVNYKGTDGGRRKKKVRS